MSRLKFKDAVVCGKERFSIGIEESSGRFYLSVPVSNGLIDFEEYYEIGREAFALYQANPKAALRFVERCGSRDADEHLIYQPSKKRGSSI